VPVVAVESGAVAEIVENGRNGILTSPDPTKIANQLSGLFSNPMQRSVLKQSALNAISASAQLKKMLPAHISLYRENLAVDGFNSSLKKH
jgi:glycosyltransferase involved in cell wall biosynthesis